jgi:hypothetical protein
VSDDGADRPPVPPPEEERGVHVTRDAPGTQGAGGRKPSKLGFRVQAQRRAKGDDPVFDNVRPPEPPLEPAAPTDAPAADGEVDADAGAGADEPEEKSPGVLDRVARFFRRSDTDRST